MNAAQKIIFLKNLSSYFREKRDIEISEKKLEWYWQCLCDYELEEVSKAIKFHDRDPKRGGFSPKPADIISKIENSLISNHQKIISCQFSKKLGPNGNCKKIGAIAYGREVHRSSFWAEGDRNEKFFDLFEKEFWMGRRLICSDHFYFIRDGSWINQNDLNASER